MEKTILIYHFRYNFQKNSCFICEKRYNFLDIVSKERLWIFCKKSPYLI